MLSRLILSRLRPYRRLLGGVVVFQLFGTIANLYLPSLNADIIDKGISRGDIAYIWRIGGWMLAVTLIAIGCSVVAVYFGAKAAMGFGRDVRAEVFHRVGEFSGREMNQFGAPSLITRSTNDVLQVQMLVVMTCTMLVSAPIMLTGGVVMALRQDVGLSWLMLVAVPALVVPLFLIIRRMVPGFRVMQDRIDTLNKVLREQISGIRVVRAFVREPYERQRFGAVNDDLVDVATAVGKLQVLIFPTVMLVLNVSTVAVLWFGAHRVESGQMPIGAMTAYVTYLVQILMSVMMATFMLMMVPRAAVCAERITEVLNTRSSVAPPEVATAPGSARGELRLRDVEFSYPGADSPVLRGVSFTAHAGQTTAIVGSTGAGKTTLLSLIPRLFDPTGGIVEVDGVDVRELDAAALWSRVSIVPQRTYLFSGTIASNLRYGNPMASDDELLRCLQVAQAADFVSELPDGLETAVAQGGTNLSGGQRQRIAIARALVRAPEIYLFDDSFSALDLGTDRRLRAALRPFTADATVLIVAQRVSTIIDADQIIVLEGGRVVGIGRHDELLRTCATYAEIVESQLSADAA